MSNVDKPCLLSTLDEHDQHNKLPHTERTLYSIMRKQHEEQMLQFHLKNNKNLAY